MLVFENIRSRMGGVENCQTAMLPDPRRRRA
jgi:hypothetical protein